MKNLIKQLFTILALVVGIGVAAASQKADTPSGILKYWDGTQWLVVPSGQNFNCRVEPTRDCTAEFNPNGSMIPDTLEKGIYTPVNP